MAQKATPSKAKRSPQNVFRTKAQRSLTQLQNVTTRHFERLRTRGYVPTADEEKKLRAWVQGEVDRINAAVDRACSEEPASTAPAKKLDW